MTKQTVRYKMLRRNGNSINMIRNMHKNNCVGRDESNITRKNGRKAILNWGKNNAMSIDSEGRTALHRACDSGNKMEVQQLLSDLEKCGILNDELFRHDKMGKTALGVALADRKKEFSQDNNDTQLELDRSYQARQETAKAMFDWIECNAPEKATPLMRVILQRQDSKGRTVLHKACDSGNKDKVLSLLSEMKQYDMLKEGLFAHDNSGRTALCLARADRKKKWNRKIRDWEVIEPTDLYLDRVGTAQAMLQWIEDNARDILDEINIR